MKFNWNKDISPKYLYLALSVICIVLIVLSAFMPDALRPVRSLTGKLIVPLQKGVNNIGEYVDEKLQVFGDIKELKEENAELKARISEYQKELSQNQAELTELAELRMLYNLDDLYPDYEKTGARVFSVSGSKWFNEFYIDKGLNDGVYENCNVLCDNGLLGIVTESYPDYAKVRAIIDDHSYITGEIGVDGTICNVEGSLQSMENGYILGVDIDKNANIVQGDRVITSNVSDRFLYGITIGYVIDISNDSNNLTKTAKIAPSVDFSEIKDVSVILERKQEIGQQ